MNLHQPQQSRPRGTRSADGFDRRAFTVAEILCMQDIGIIGEDERFELLEGDIVLMQAKNFAHERIKLALNRLLSRALPETLQLGVETTLYLSDRTFLEPDLTVFAMMNTEHVRGSDVLLAIEVAHTTLRYDLGCKAELYARYGVRELWVIDAQTLQTHRHRTPTDGHWGTVDLLDGGAVLTHPSAPGFSIVLADL